jgi:hypothetical protein
MGAEVVGGEASFPILLVDGEPSPWPRRPASSSLRPRQRSSAEAATLSSWPSKGRSCHGSKPEVTLLGLPSCRKPFPAWGAFGRFEEMAIPARRMGPACATFPPELSLQRPAPAQTCAVLSTQPRTARAPTFGNTPGAFVVETSQRNPRFDAARSESRTFVLLPLVCLTALGGTG